MNANAFNEAPDGMAETPGRSPDDAGGPGAAESTTDRVERSPAEMSERLRKAEEEAAMLKDSYLRARADTENVRRQAQADVAKAHRYGIEKFAESLLPVKDALESALADRNAQTDTLRAGVELTLRQLNTAFEKAQLAEINPVGERFDPHVHQAIQMVPSEQPENTVVQVMQKGYRLNDRVLRPAMVVVAAPNGGSQRGGGT